MDTRLIRHAARHDFALLLRNRRMIAGAAVGLGIVLMIVMANAKERPAPELIGLFFFLFIGAGMSIPVSIATNALVLEKERGTIEPLMLLPISPELLVAAKAAVTMILSLAGLALVYAVGLAMLGIIAPQSMGAFFDPRVVYTATVLTPLMVLPFTLLAIAISARSPDAQTASATTFVMLVPLFTLLIAVWLGIIQVGQRLLTISTVSFVLLSFATFRFAVGSIEAERMIKRRT